LPGRVFHRLHGVGGNAQGAIAPGETVTLPNNIDLVVLRENRGEFAIVFHDEPEGFHQDGELRRAIC
jgi:hypothetical protein